MFHSGWVSANASVCVDVCAWTLIEWIIDCVNIHSSLKRSWLIQWVTMNSCQHSTQWEACEFQSFVPVHLPNFPSLFRLYSISNQLKKTFRYFSKVLQSHNFCSLCPSTNVRAGSWFGEEFSSLQTKTTTTTKTTKTQVVSRMSKPFSTTTKLDGEMVRLTIDSENRHNVQLKWKELV